MLVEENVQEPYAGLTYCLLTLTNILPDEEAQKSLAFQGLDWVLGALQSKCTDSCQYYAQSESNLAGMSGLGVHYV